MRKLILGSLLLLFSALSFAEEDTVHLDHMKPSLSDINLQRGARTFINYCLNCHSASGVRYALLEKIGLTKEEILKYLAPGKKISNFMISSMPHADAAKWFGVSPPDLSLEARARGVDWLYTYLRSFYRDNNRLNGWNNVVFPNVSMPNPLYDMQGVHSVVFDEVTAVHDKEGHVTGYLHTSKTYPGDGSVQEQKTSLSGKEHIIYHRVIWGQSKKAMMTPVAYDQTIRDLVSFMAYIAEPSSPERQIIGFFFLTWLLLLSGLLYALKVNFWKDVH